MNHTLFIRTASRWNIPRDLALAVITRDDRCIYCRRVFGGSLRSRADCPSWEHIVNDESLVSAENIALSCVGCNASKGTKPLEKWLKSRYCEERGITSNSIAAVALNALGEVATETTALNPQTASAPARFPPSE